MKFCLYTSTLGLERFPEAERFKVWRSTHKRLMQDDNEYRLNVSRYRSRIIWFTVLLVIAEMFLTAAVVGSVTRSTATIVGNVMCNVIFVLAYTIYVIVAAFRMQEFMNDKVGKALP